MGYVKYMLGMEEVKEINRRCMEQIEKEPGEPVAFAIVDDSGDIISCLRMDGAKPLQLELAVCKAYTASIGELCSSEFGERDKGWGRELANYHENRFTHIAGGSPIRVVDKISGKTMVIGGVGVSGRMPEIDEKIARISSEFSGG